MDLPQSFTLLTGHGHLRCCHRPALWVGVLVIHLLAPRFRFSGVRLGVNGLGPRMYACPPGDPRGCSLQQSPHFTFLGVGSSDSAAGKQARGLQNGYGAAHPHPRPSPLPLFCRLGTSSTALGSRLRGAPLLHRRRTAPRILSQVAASRVRFCWDRGGVRRHLTDHRQTGRPGPDLRIRPAWALPATVTNRGSRWRTRAGARRAAPRWRPRLPWGRSHPPITTHLTPGRAT